MSTLNVHEYWIDRDEFYECSACHSVDSCNSDFCPECGARMHGTVDVEEYANWIIEENCFYCSHCGSPNYRKSDYCPHCGIRMNRGLEIVRRVW